MSLARSVQAPAGRTHPPGRPRSFEGDLARAFEFAASRAWRGFDPYDGLLSPVARLPLLNRSRVWRLAITQVVKRSSLNLRPLLGIAPGLIVRATLASRRRSRRPQTRPVPPGSAPVAIGRSGSEIQSDQDPT